MAGGEDRVRELIRAVGSQRDAHTPEELTVAEQEIARRLGGSAGGS